MKISPHRLLGSLFLSIFFADFGGASALAGPPVDLTLTEGGGHIVIEGSAAEPYQIRIDISETSSERWRGVPAKSKIEPVAGQMIERVSEHEFPDGSEVRHTTVAAIEGNAVTVKAEWPTGSMAPGFSRVDFWLPVSEAETTTISIDGEDWWRDGEVLKRGRAENPGEIVGTRTTDGAELFRITGAVTGAGVHFLPNEPHLGVTIRLSPVPDANKAAIGDVQEFSWKVEFPES